jgi:hypothetical protein
LSARDLFEYDLFFSYASQSDMGGRLLSSWSSQFKAALEEWTNIRLQAGENAGPLMRIKFDRGTDADTGRFVAGGLNEQIDRALEASALMIILMSPAYLRSEVCRYEAEAWARRSPRLDGDLSQRLIILEVWPTHGMDWPQQLKSADGKRLISTPLYRPGEEEPIGFGDVWFGNREPPDVPEDLRVNLIRIANVVRDQLQKMDRELTRQQAAIAQITRLRSPDPSRPTSLYFYGRSNHDADWQGMCDMLANLHVVVWPDTTETVSAASGEEECIRKRIALGSDAMLILACRPDELAEDMRVVGFDRRNAIEAEKPSPLPCAVLDRIGQAGSSRRLQNAKRYSLGWIDATMQDWPMTLRDWLAAQAGRMES